jgi:hypothetical protein
MTEAPSIASQGPVPAGILQTLKGHYSRGYGVIYLAHLTIRLSRCWHTFAGITYAPQSEERNI